MTAVCNSRTIRYANIASSEDSLFSKFIVKLTYSIWRQKKGLSTVASAEMHALVSRSQMQSFAVMKEGSFDQRHALFSL